MKPGCAYCLPHSTVKFQEDRGFHLVCPWWTRTEINTGHITFVSFVSNMTFVNGLEITGLHVATREYVLQFTKKALGNYDEKKSKYRGWRDGSALTSTACSSRGLGSFPSNLWLLLSVTSVMGDLTLSCRHTCRPNASTFKIKINYFKKTPTQSS